MVRGLWTLVVVFGLSIGTAAAQEVDARAALLASLKAMGGENLKTIEISAGGSSSLIGQQYSVEGNWPQFEVANYTRAIDFDAKWSREDYTRRQGNFPAFGRVPMAEQRITAIVSGSYAWDMRDTMPVPITRGYMDGVAVSDLRQLELAITPHGFLKTALAAKDAKAIRIQYIGASDFGLSQFGRWVTMVEFTFLGKYKIVGTIDDRNLVELVGTWFPNPVYGDMDYEMRYTEYKDFGGVKFPMLLHTHQGDPRLNTAHNYYEYRVTSVKPNAPVTTMPVPEAVRTAVTPRARVASQQLATGVWLLGGGTHNSLLVEFKDYVAVVDAPNNEERSLAVIAEAARLAPGKPVQYVINTHHHFDHAGGLRTYLSQGTTIVTHETNKQYYLDIMFYPAPRTLQPDRMALFNPMYWISRRPPPIETVAGEPRSSAKYVVTDGERILEVIKVQDVAYELGERSYAQGNHSVDMLIAYLPKEKILFNADLYSPPAEGAQPTPPTPSMRTLQQNIRKLKLDVTQHAPAHGRVGTQEEFLRLVTRTSQTN
ncbi:MAG TPA: MBL fold metallo-hydrolase [Vicinamibacterales bacterium]|nr:MBL fold metallo-hydrolase [Vicinamibacterales bacterium]